MYTVELDDSIEDVEIEVDASHPWGLPGATCPTCKASWAGTGVAYPSVDPGPLLGKVSLEAELVAWDEYVRRREILRPHLPPGVLTLVQPGIEIGPLQGKARGEFADLIFCGPWTLLISEDAFENLTHAGVEGLVAVPTEITRSGGRPFPYFEVEAHPHLRYAPECIPEDTSPPCATCARWPVRPREPPAFLASSWPASLDVIRGREATTRIFVSDRFVQAARSLGLRGAKFTEVKLV